MANISLGDAFLRLGADLGPLKNDLASASAIVKQEVRNIVDSLNGIKVTPQLIDQASAKQAFALYQQLNSELFKTSANANEASQKLTALVATFGTSAQEAALKLKQVRTVEEAMEKAHLQAIAEDQERTRAANAAKLADTLSTIRAEESARRALDKQRQAALKEIAADEDRRSKELQARQLGDLAATARIQGVNTLRVRNNDESIEKAQLDAIAEAQKRVKQGYQEIGGALVGLRTAGLTLTTFVTAPLLFGAKAALEYAGNMERVTVSLKNTAGGTEPAIRLLNEVKELALHSPFDFSVLLQGTKRLNAFGFEAKDVTGILKTLGDATAAVGGDSGTLNRLIKAIGDIKQKGFLTGEEIRQLGNAPLGAVKIIAEELGVTTDTILKSVKAKAIDANQAIALILDGINKKFGDEQQRQAETFPGQLNKLRTEYQFFAADVGKTLLPTAKELVKFGESILETGRKAADYFAGLPQPIREVGLAIGGLAVVTGPALTSVGQLGLGIKGLVDVFGLLRKSALLTEFAGGLVVAGPWIAVAGAIGLATYELQKFYDAGKGTPVKTTVAERVNAASHTTNIAKADGTFLSPLSEFLAAPKAISDAQKAKDDLAAKLKATQDTEAAKERDKAFSTIGLTDVQKAYKDTAAAVDLLWNSLSRTEKSQATDALESRLRDLAKQGKITAAQFDADMAKIEARLDKAGGQVTITSPKLFTPPPGSDAATELSRLKQERLKKEFDDTKRVILDYKTNLEALSNVLGGSTDATDLYRASLLHTSETQGDIEQRLNLENIALGRTDAGAKALTKSFEHMAEVLGSTGKVDTSGIARVQATLKDFGIVPKTGVSELTADYKFLLEERQKNVRFADGSELISVQTLEQAWYKLAQAHLEAGEKLSPSDEKQYLRIQKQISGVKLLNQAYRDFGSQVSTIFTDLAKNAADLLVPKQTAAQPLVPDNITSAFKDAFNTLSGKGYADADKRLKDVTQSIINAGTAAEANAIAVRTFGQQGPVIANLLRTGQLSVEQINYAIKQGTDVLGKYKDESQGVSKISQLWHEVEVSIVRALLESGAKAIAKFTIDSIRPLIKDLEGLLTKIPLIGGALAKVFGIGGVTAKLPSLGGLGGGSDPASAVGIEEIAGLGGAGASIAKTGADVASKTGGAAGAVSQTLGATVTGIVGAVSGVVSAVSGVIGNFQLTHISTDTGRIEASTRGMLNVLVGAENHDESIFGFTKKTMQYQVYIHDRLVEIGNKIIDPVTTTLEGIEQQITNLRKANPEFAGAAAGGDIYNIYIDGKSLQTGDAGIIQTAQALTKLLKARGVRGA